MGVASAPREFKIHNFISGNLPADIEVIVFGWSNRYGHCYECGTPAAYYVPEPSKPTGYLGLPLLELLDVIEPHELLCSVCAAQRAAQGETIVWLFEEDMQ